MIDSCVVDASVGIKLFVAEEFSEAADRFFRRLTTTPPANFYVPDLFFVECANILWKYTRRFDYPADHARQNIHDLRALALHTVSTADLIEPAFDLALTYNLTTYDASYVALARQLDLPLITADDSLLRKLNGSDISVQTLKDVDASFTDLTDTLE
ncbi:MAG: type II toxin-antitoxin system VapC family toxin [Anaerolineae bacterium]